MRKLFLKKRSYTKVKKDVENYKWREINGIMINQPLINLITSEMLQDMATCLGTHIRN